jgi:uncharacterized membrane protein YfcA
MDPERPRPKPTLYGCVLTVLVAGGIVYGSIAGFGYAVWGPGLSGAMDVQRDPAAMHTFTKIAVYSTRLEATESEFRVSRTLWSCVRTALLIAIAVAVATAALQRRIRSRAAAILFVLALPAASALLIVWSPRVVFHHAAQRVDVERLFATRSWTYDQLQLRAVSGDVGGGRVGTRDTTASWKAQDVWLVTRDGRRIATLLSLPFETRNAAEQWRDEIARRTGVIAH